MNGLAHMSCKKKSRQYLHIMVISCQLASFSFYQRCLTNDAKIQRIFVISIEINDVLTRHGLANIVELSEWHF